LKLILKSNKDAAQKAVLITLLAPELPTTDAIGALLDEALLDADPLVQVAIMDAWFEMTGDKYYEKNGNLEKILKKAARMGDGGEQLYMAARVALGRMNGLSMDSLDKQGDGELVITAQALKRRGALKIANEITVIIHGTWASDGTWWRPNGDFFEYVKTELGRSDLYGKPDQFKWSGKNRDDKRLEAGIELDKWLRSHLAHEVNVFAHSHGANVAMLATRKGIRIDRLIMLSPPVRSDYFAKWENVGKAYNIQASFDPVVAIARGGNSFKDEGVNVVKEKTLKASGHSASHDPEVWQTEKLAEFIELPSLGL
jgi:pimeloyl-ACP methyl ester carboxylesterase